MLHSTVHVMKEVLSCSNRSGKAPLMMMGKSSKRESRSNGVTSGQLWRFCEVSWLRCRVGDYRSWPHVVVARHLIARLHPPTATCALRLTTSTRLSYHVLISLDGMFEGSENYESDNGRVPGPRQGVRRAAEPLPQSAFRVVLSFPD